MTTQVLICDDSSLALRQMAGALPDHWDIEITLASQGQEALDAIRAGKGDILFLDLNMPQMDGYQVLEQIRQHDLPTLTIVVSGDIQPKAEQRVRELGALAFVRKPFKPEQMQQVLKEYGLLLEIVPTTTGRNPPETSPDYLEVCQELANVAMGKAGERLARWLGVFIRQPIPRVTEVAAPELAQTLQRAIPKDASLVRQGFVGGGLAGEAMFICEHAHLPALAAMAGYPVLESQQQRDELILDLASIMTGAFLTSLADQLDTSFSQHHPQLMRQFPEFRPQPRDTRALCIELPYRLDEPDVSCELLLLLSPDSLPMLKQRLIYFMD